MNNNSLLLLVEGQTDKQIVTWLLKAAQKPLNKINIKSLDGKENIINLVANFPQKIADNCAILVDLDSQSIPDGIMNMKQKINNSSVEIFCAIPTIESWLFADEITAINHIQEEWMGEVIKNLPPPEEITKPKELAHLFFGENFLNWYFLETINLNRAIDRSASLRYFLTGIERLLSTEIKSITEIIGRNISRDIFAGLINEVVPADTIIWKTAQGELFTAKELRKHIEDGTEIGQQYASDVLRVARDFLKTMAKKGE